jgi:hypothetical protein
MKTIRLMQFVAGLMMLLAGSLFAAPGDPGMDWSLIRSLPANVEIKIKVKSAGTFKGKWISSYQATK